MALQDRRDQQGQQGRRGQQNQPVRRDPLALHVQHTPRVDGPVNPFLIGWRSSRPFQGSDGRLFGVANFPEKLPAWVGGDSPSECSRVARVFNQRQNLSEANWSGVLPARVLIGIQLRTNPFLSCQKHPNALVQPQYIKPHKNTVGCFPGRTVC
jgi:hypothetical protein